MQQSCHTHYETECNWVQEIMLLPPATSLGKGSKGRALKVKTNHFPVKCSATDAMQYNLDFQAVGKTPPQSAAAGPRLPERAQKDPPKDVLRSGSRCLYAPQAGALGAR